MNICSPKLCEKKKKKMTVYYHFHFIKRYHNGFISVDYSVIYRRKVYDIKILYEINTARITRTTYTYDTA